MCLSRGCVISDGEGGVWQAEGQRWQPRLCCGGRGLEAQRQEAETHASQWWRVTCCCSWALGVCRRQELFETLNCSCTKKYII